MSTKRTISISDLEKRRKGFCTWCAKAVKKPKIYWCGNDDCLRQYRLRSDTGYLRSAVFERDKGVCAECGLDTEALAAAFKEAIKTACQDATDKFKALGFKIKNSVYGTTEHLWENNHRLAVSEGGGASWDKDFDILANCETLCLNCHKKHTAGVNKRRRAKSQ
jgi:5-methylcytosine-specific restriction protein A